MKLFTNIKQHKNYLQKNYQENVRHYINYVIYYNYIAYLGIMQIIYNHYVQNLFQF